MLRCMTAIVLNAENAKVGKVKREAVCTDC